MKKISRTQAIDVSLLLLRIAAAVIFVCAGGAKLFGWFGGPGISQMPALMIFAGILEVFGGLAILLGIYTRIVAFILSGEMAFAYFMGHFAKGILPIQNNGEAAFLLCFIYLFLAAYGAGRFSLDSKVRKAEPILSDVMTQSNERPVNNP